jgi:selenocysteine lyase/cysteine desulfurase
MRQVSAPDRARPPPIRAHRSRSGRQRSDHRIFYGGSGMANAYNAAEQRFWRHVRDQFVLEHPRVNLAHSSIAPHSHVVRRAIARHAEGLDTEGWPYLSFNLGDSEDRARQAASEYCFPGKKLNIALTEGTLQGLALMYAGLRIGPDQEVLTSHHEFPLVYTCLEARQERERRTNFVRRIDLFDLPNFDPDTVIERIAPEVRDNTRLLALTWVYSNTGVKLPISAIGEWVRKRNAGRADEDRLLLCVDGVHGFGVEDTTFPELQCDFLVSGCHKWVFGPRGTGVWLGTDDAWKQMTEVIPSTSGSDTPAMANSPGGLHSYEHRWALDEAFRFLDRRIGKRRIQARVHGLATRFKDALLGMKHVKLTTPVSPAHSSGLICFDVLDAGGEPIASDVAVRMLRRAGVVATPSSGNMGRPDVHHVRIAVSILNDDDEIDRAIQAIEDLG